MADYVLRIILLQRCVCQLIVSSFYGAVRAAGLGQARVLTFIRAARASTNAQLSSRTSQATFYLCTTLLLS